MKGIWSEFAEEGLNEMQEQDARFKLLLKRDLARILFVEKQILDRAPVRALDWQFVDVAGWQVKAAQRSLKNIFRIFPGRSLRNQRL